jgi:hypothetical protein
VLAGLGRSFVVIGAKFVGKFHGGFFHGST